MKTTKAEISKIFAELRKYNFLVYNFNQKNRFGRGLVGFVDHLIIGKNRIWFIEVKIGKDMLSREQIDLLTRLKAIGKKFPMVEWSIVTHVEFARKLQEQILSIR